MWCHQACVAPSASIGARRATVLASESSLTSCWSGNSSTMLPVAVIDGSGRCVHEAGDDFAKAVLDAEQLVAGDVGGEVDQNLVVVVRRRSDVNRHQRRECEWQHGRHGVRDRRDKRRADERNVGRESTRRRRRRWCAGGWPSPSSSSSSSSLSAELER
jgi:hypothetical protein